MSRCEYEDCNQEAHFALYQFKKNFTKKWVNVYDEHDKLIASANSQLRRGYPNKIFKEVYESKL